MLGRVTGQVNRRVEFRISMRSRAEIFRFSMKIPGLISISFLITISSSWNCGIAYSLAWKNGKSGMPELPRFDPAHSKFQNNIVSESDLIDAARKIEQGREIEFGPKFRA